jgi:mono/diheme cytochrome c family protein
MLQFQIVYFWMALLQATGATQAPADLFEMRVRPVLAANCYACHREARMGGLRLDSRAELMKGGASGPAIVVGKSEESLMMRAVLRTHERFKMPPPPQQALKPEEIAGLAAWIDGGAVWPEGAVAKVERSFWSLQPVSKPEPPTVRDSASISTPIDRFVLARLETAGLSPNGRADRRTLIRRATFDLIGLPPTPEEVEAFVNDTSPRPFEKVIDRLLSSPHYGERWGRHWLDLARYADGEVGVTVDTPFRNAFRYRDWVVDALNKDMPYNLFVKAQIAADQMPESAGLLAGLGFQAIGEDNHERVDVSTRVFLGLTVGCAQCHDHKYDPIPTKDYYSLLGVFTSSKKDEYPLAAPAEVETYKKQKLEIDGKQGALTDWLNKQISDLVDILAAQTTRYIVSAWTVMTGERGDVFEAANQDSLDAVTIGRWIKYLRNAEKDYAFVKPWFDLVASRGGMEKLERSDVKKIGDEIQTLLLSILAEKKAIDDRNYVKLGGAKGVKDEATRQYANLEFLEPKKYYFWRDMASEPYRRDGFDSEGGIYYHGPKEIDQFLPGTWKQHLESLRNELDALKKALPEQYPFLHVLHDGDKPANEKIAIRGDAQNLGEEAPRRFLQALCEGEPPPFTNGSGRLELAESIASASNPLTARVIVNRVWQWHFGEGIVRSSSNFGQLGDRPTHPELLDYLAARFIEQGWSLKTLHRDIMLSSVYQLSSSPSAMNSEKDPDNRLLWRANLTPRLDAESLRDAMLAVSGSLDCSIGGPATPLADDFRRRTLYGTVSRTQPEATLALFDFPNPNNSSERRSVTIGPMQRLYFLNNSFVAAQAKALAERVQKIGDDPKRITEAYKLLFSREPTGEELKLGREFLAEGLWPQYVQVLLSSSEFSSVR